MKTEKAKLVWKSTRYDPDDLAWLINLTSDSRLSFSEVARLAIAHARNDPQFEQNLEPFKRKNISAGACPANAG